MACLYGYGNCSEEKGKHDCCGICPQSHCPVIVQSPVDAESAERYYPVPPKGMLDRISSDQVRQEIQDRRTDTLEVDRGTPRVVPEPREIGTYNYDESEEDDAGISPVHSDPEGYQYRSPAGNISLQTSIEEHPLVPHYIEEHERLTVEPVLPISAVDYPRGDVLPQYNDPGEVEGAKGKVMATIEGEVNAIVDGLENIGTTERERIRNEVLHEYRKAMAAT